LSLACPKANHNPTPQLMAPGRHLMQGMNPMSKRSAKRGPAAQSNSPGVGLWFPPLTAALSHQIGDSSSGTSVNTGRVTGPEGVLAPGVLGTVAAGVSEVEGVSQGCVARDAVPGPRDHDAGAFIPDGSVAPQHVVVSCDLKAAANGKDVCGRGEVIDQAVLVPPNGDACARTQDRATGDTVHQVIVIAKDSEGWIDGALGHDVDELVVIALHHKDVPIHDRACHVPHGMPTAAFQDDALVQPSGHRAVQELGAHTREDNTSDIAREAIDDVPIQVQDGPVPHRDSAIATLQVVLQLKPASRPEDISALNVIGVGGCHAAERDPDRSEQHDHTIGHSTPLAEPSLDRAGVLQVLRLLFQRFESLTEVVPTVHVLILHGLE
jgi:hypothetical protein